MLSESTVKNTELHCHVCGEQKLNLLAEYPSLPRVASDCVPWRSGGRLGTCAACKCVQNPVDKEWHSETSEVYSKYKIYTQSAGSEQGVFAGGQPLIPRSAKIFQQAKPYIDLNSQGRLLDIGCANGELLRYFATLAPHWKMIGFEIDDKRRKEVESISGVEEFASGSLDKLTKPFDLITLIHVLEHLPDPKQWLEDLHRLLTPNGMVLIQVPDPRINPYNLLVADHCSHFIMPDLINVAKRAGYDVIACSDQWVSREFSLLIQQSNKTNTANDITIPEKLLKRESAYPKNSVQWLHDIVAQAKSIPNDKPRGIWGTAIAATWLYSLMDSNVDFFVDEDPNRIGQQHLGKPVYSPETAPKHSNIFIALTPEIATNIASRWKQLDVNLIEPPKLVYQDMIQ